MCVFVHIWILCVCVCVYVCAPENSSLQFPREALYTNFQLWAITHSAHTSTYRLMRSSEDPVMWLGPVMWAEPLPVFSLYAGRRVTRGCDCIRMIYIHLWYIGNLWGRNQRNSLLCFPLNGKESVIFACLLSVGVMCLPVPPVLDVLAPGEGLYIYIYWLSVETDELQWM